MTEAVIISKPVHWFAEQINGFYMITASVMKGLMSNHSYYYQVQTQLLVTGFKFCDFFVWTEKDTFLETIRVDTEIQADILSNIKSLFCSVLLPELVGKYKLNYQW